MEAEVFWSTRDRNLVGGSQRPLASCWCCCSGSGHVRLCSSLLLFYFLFFFCASLPWFSSSLIFHLIVPFFSFPPCPPPPPNGERGLLGVSTLFVCVWNMFCCFVSVFFFFCMLVWEGFMNYLPSGTCFPSCLVQLLLFRLLLSAIFGVCFKIVWC